MADRKGATAAANKIAMSRALGAAFLNHQVEQLEKSVGNGPASGNWRDRRLGQPPSHVPASAALPKRPTNSPSAKPGNRKKGGEVQIIGGTRERDVPRNRDVGRNANVEAAPKRRSLEEDKSEKDADVVVVDASVLIHGLDHVKKWCRNGREEIVVVPLEALNTLDLLKKGSTTLAQRARAASRILESQVGTNVRIHVQRDEAFLPWDGIPFQSSASDGSETAEKDKTSPPNSSPEWVRRTICCARWEVEHPTSEEGKAPADVPATSAKAKVLLAICNGQSLSPQSISLKLAETAESPLAPVPLPAPVLPYANKHEPRTTGTLVAYWAARAGIAILDVKPTPLAPATGGNPRSSSEDERPKRIPNMKARRPNQGNGPAEGGKGLVERSPAVMAMMEMVSQPTKVVRVLARGEKLDPDT